MLQGSTATEAYVMVSTTGFLLSVHQCSPTVTLLEWPERGIFNLNSEVEECPRTRRRPRSRESECFTIGLTEQNRCRTNGGLCRHRTPMHRGRARRRGRER